MTLYVHQVRDEDHPAFVTRRRWVRGDILRAEDIEWPDGTKPGDLIKCGTCGHRFLEGQLGLPWLATKEDT